MKIVLITGCSSGFGKDSALEFARRGDRVFASMRNLEKADSLMLAAEKEGLSIDLVQLDVTDDASVNKAVQEVMEKAGRVDVLVNNAGIGSIGPFEYHSLDDVRSVFETNYFGVVRMCHAVVPIMRAQGDGKIINISSISGLRVFPMFGVYAASKHALEALNESLCYELLPFGIKLVSVEPGSFKTEIQQNVNLRISKEFGDRENVEIYKTMLQGLFAIPPEPADAGEVVKVIVDAAYEDDPPLRLLVGEDALEEAARTLEEHREFVEQLTRDACGIE